MEKTIRRQIVIDLEDKQLEMIKPVARSIEVTNEKGKKETFIVVRLLCKHKETGKQVYLKVRIYYDYKFNADSKQMEIDYTSEPSFEPYETVEETVNEEVTA